MPVTNNVSMPDLVSSGYSELGYWWSGFGNNYRPLYVDNPRVSLLPRQNVNPVIRIFKEDKYDWSVAIFVHETPLQQYQLGFEVAHCDRCAQDGRCYCMFITSY